MPIDLPLYRFCSGPPAEWTPGELNYTPGRLLCPQATQTHAQPGDFLTIMGGLDGVDKYVGPNDVLGIQLFKGAVVSGLEPPWPAPMVDDRADILDVIRHVGPRIAGVLIGNQGVELSWRHLHGNWRGNAAGNIDMICGFIHEVGTLVRSCGAVPYFAIMDWDLIQDAYLCGWKAQEALREVEAINYCACGYSMIPGAQYGRHDAIGLQQRWLNELEGQGQRDFMIDDEVPRLRAYLSAGRHWSGVGGKVGVLGGNLRRLRQYGFIAAVAALNAAAIREVDQILGDSWR